MKIQRESTPMSEDHGMELITRLIDRIMERIQDVPGSASVRLSDSEDEKVRDAESTISIMSEELNVASSQLTNLVLDEIKATNIPQNKDKKVRDAESTISITSKDLNVASSQLTNLVLDEIKATNVPQNKDKKVRDAESTTISITSKDLNVASSQLTNLVLDDIRATFGQKKKNEKSTMTDQIPDFDPTCKKILIQPHVTIRIPISFQVTVKEQPEEAPAKKAICTAEKRKKKKDQILDFFRRSWKTMKRIFPKRRNKVYPL